MVVERVAWRWVEMRFAIPGDGFEQRSSCNLKNREVKNREVDLLLLVALHRSTLVLVPRTDYRARYGSFIVVLILSSRTNIDRI